MTSPAASSSTPGNKDTEDEKRWLRQQYRQLIHDTEESRQEWITGDRNHLLENLQRASSLYERVQSTADATLDSKLLVLSADLGAQRAQHRNVELRQLDIEDFLVRVQQKLRRAPLVEDAAGPSTAQWMALGQMSRKYLQTAPTGQWMLGPLSIEHKARKASKQTRLVRDKSALQKPEELKASDIKKDENETTKNILGIYRRLEEVGPLPFWQFVCNPDSFSQTVENIFYCAFLARDGKISVHDTDDCPLPDAMIEATEPVSEEERAEMQKFQYIVSLDMKAWRGLTEKYGIVTSMIPTRAPVQTKLNNSGGSKWYG